MRKGLECDDDKRNISVVICDTDIHLYYITVNQVMVACPIGTLGSVASMLAATLYQGNHDMDHKLWNIGSIERDMLHIYMQVLLEVATYQWKIHNRKIEIISLIVKFSSMSYTILAFN